MNRQWIEEYVACGPRLRQAVAGLSREDLTARPGPGNWSILELVLHLADSDGISIDRMKRMLTEDNPSLLYADETAYVDRLFSHDQWVGANTSRTVLCQYLPNSRGYNSTKTDPC
jgi:uncharacterized damage-inducible protein DinB